MTTRFLAHRTSQFVAASQRATNVKAAAVTATKPAPIAELSHVTTPTTYSFVDNSELQQFDAGFSEYAKATQKLAEMQRLSEALLSNLEEINSLSLQTLVSICCPCDVNANAIHSLKLIQEFAA